MEYYAGMSMGGGVEGVVPPKPKSKKAQDALKKKAVAVVEQIQGLPAPIAHAVVEKKVKAVVKKVAKHMDELKLLQHIQAKIVGARKNLTGIVSAVSRQRKALGGVELGGAVSPYSYGAVKSAVESDGSKLFHDAEDMLPSGWGVGGARRRPRTSYRKAKGGDFWDTAAAFAPLALSFL